MRRKGYDIISPVRQRALEDACKGLAPEAIIAALSPFVTEARLARIHQVIDARIGSVSVLIDAPHDPQNGAALMRTCDAFGVQHLHVVERRETFLTSSTVARGSEKWINLHTYAKAHHALDALKTGGFELVATRMNGELLPADLRSIPRFCLLLGTEKDGLTADLESAATRSVRVPMRGMAESLNVSATAAILLQHALDGRPGDLPTDERTALVARGLLRTVEHAREVLIARDLLRDDIPRTA